LIDPALSAALATADEHAIATTQVSDSRAHGVVSADADRLLSAIVEKPDDPPTDLANVGGCYAFQSEVFEYIEQTDRSERGEYEITDTLELLLEDGRDISVVEYDARWLDIGRPRELLRANELLLEDIDWDTYAAVAEEAHVDVDVIINPGVTVRGKCTHRRPRSASVGCGGWPKRVYSRCDYNGSKRPHRPQR
jgi:bifunctional UDP-N-acetylglucosamine pyrophosphorylase/glucosamine-1-phosphate N-acetyltransferase